MAVGEPRRGGGEMFVFQWLDFDPGHRGGTIALGGMPKTLTGEELQLDDAPARDSELFLVDGNNLAYRAFFALPEELATSEGFSTNALLGFTNMLFKLLGDYKPKGVASRGIPGRCIATSCSTRTRSSGSRCRACSRSNSRTSGRSSRPSGT